MELLVVVAVPAAVAFLLSFLFASRPAGAAGVAGVGAAIAVGAIAWIVLAAPTDPGNCADCTELLGRYVSPILMFLVVVGLAGWLVGLVTGAALRRTTSRRAEANR